jgi:hypothetical protein
MPVAAAVPQGEGKGKTAMGQILLGLLCLALCFVGLNPDMQ